MTMSKQRSGRVEGKVCVVSGGARGLGLAAAEALLAAGAKVLLTDVDAVAGETAAQRLGANATFMKPDVVDAAQWHTVLDAATAACGRRDVLVHQNPKSHSEEK